LRGETLPEHDLRLAAHAGRPAAQLQLLQRFVSPQQRAQSERVDFGIPSSLAAVTEIDRVAYGNGLDDPPPGGEEAAGLFHMVGSHYKIGIVEHCGVHLDLLRKALQRVRSALNLVPREGPVEDGGVHADGSSHSQLVNDARVRGFVSV